MKSLVIPVRYSEKDVEDFDGLVKDGVFTSRSQAIKASSQLGVSQIQTRRALTAISCYLSFPEKDRKTPSEKIARKIRKELLEEAMHETSGDESKALDLIGERANAKAREWGLI